MTGTIIDLRDNPSLDTKGVGSGDGADATRAEMEATLEEGLSAPGIEVVPDAPRVEGGEVIEGTCVDVTHEEPVAPEAVAVAPRVDEPVAAPEAVAEAVAVAPRVEEPVVAPEAVAEAVADAPRVEEPIGGEDRMVDAQEAAPAPAADLEARAGEGGAVERPAGEESGFYKAWKGLYQAITRDHPRMFLATGLVLAAITGICVYKTFVGWFGSEDYGVKKGRHEFTIATTHRSDSENERIIKVQNIKADVEKRIQEAKDLETKMFYEAVGKAIDKVGADKVDSINIVGELYK